MYLADSFFFLRIFSDRKFYQSIFYLILNLLLSLVTENRRATFIRKHKTEIARARDTFNANQCLSLSVSVSVSLCLCLSLSVSLSLFLYLSFFLSLSIIFFLVINVYCTKTSYIFTVKKCYF